MHIKIRKRREELGLSLMALGHRVGVQASYLERIESGHCIPKPELAHRIASVLQEPEADYMAWAHQRGDESQRDINNSHPHYPRYPEARQALIELCVDPIHAKQLFTGSAIGPLEAALYGLLIDRMSHRMADLGFWGFLSPSESNLHTPDASLLLEAFFEMLTHPEGESADYKKVFSELLLSWSYGPGPHRITVTDPDQGHTTYRLALVNREGSIIPALEPEDPFHALYRMLTPEQRADIAEICHVLLRRDQRIEIQAALEAISRWHKLGVRS